MNNVLPLRESKNGLTFNILVTPHASRAEIAGVQDGAFKVKVNAPPVEGAANEACIILLASKLELKKSQIEIFSGTKSRKKTVLIKDIGKADLEAKINNVLKSQSASCF